MVPASNDQGLNKEEELDTQTHREVHHEKASTEIGLMWPQANKCQEPPEPGRDKDESPSRTFGEEGTWSTDTLLLDFWTPEL